MILNERSYGGKLFRPRPELHISENSSLVIIATPWGDPQVATDFISTVTSHFRSQSDDTDENISAIHIEGLNFNEALLRKTLYKAHDELLEKYNDQILSAGVEALCFLKNGNNLSWFKVGAPFFALLRGPSILPLNHPIDFSFDYSIENHNKALRAPGKEPLPAPPFAPLPKNLIGTHEQLYVESGSLRLHPEDRFLFISRSYVPADFFKIDPSEITLDSATLALAREQEELPFWIALGNY